MNHKKYVLLALFVHAISIRPSAAQVSSPTFEKYKLKNGLEVTFFEYGTLPAISISSFIDVGKKAETPGQQNLSVLTAGALMLGNSKYNRAKQDSLVSLLGGNYDVSSNKNYTSVNAQFLERDLEIGMDLYANMLLKPTFPKTEIKVQIDEVLNYNNLAKMDISALAMVFTDYTVFSTANPLGRRFYQNQLREITDAQISEFYQFNYTPKNTRMVISGKFDREKVKVLLEKHFGPWQAALGEINKSVYDAPDISKKEVAFVNKTKVTQSALMWTKKAPTVANKDALPFQLANSVFGDLLFDEIRGKEGKTYGISSVYSENENTGIFTVVTQVRSELTLETMSSFDRVLKQFYDKGVTAKDLEDAKNDMKARINSMEDPLQVNAFYNPLLFVDAKKRSMLVSEIDKLNLETVNKTIKKYFTPDVYKLVIAGEEASLTEQLSAIPGLVKLDLKVVEVDN